MPFNPYENDLKDGSYPPFTPSFSERHFLGTDNVGRDVLARLVYGFRTAILFSGTLLIFNYSVGIVLGCVMGYFGERFDLFSQRILEIWCNIPFLYVVIIVSSIMLLLLIMAFFGWIQITWVMLQQGLLDQHGGLVDILLGGGCPGDHPHGGDLHRRGNPGGL